MHALKIIASASAIAMLVSMPAMAKSKKKVEEKRCEIRIVNGETTKKGDCDDVDIEKMRGGMGFEGKKVMRFDTDGEGPNMVWLQSDGHGQSGHDFSSLIGGDFPHELAFMMKHHKPEWDTNQDGELTDDEIKAGKTAEMNRYDSNRNGSISLSEYENMWVENRREQMVDGFQALDADGDGSVTREEYTKGNAHGMRMQKRVIHIERSEDHDE